MTLLKYEKQIKYSITAMGGILILTGIFFDFTWLKNLGNSYAPDGKCNFCEILNLAWIIFIAIGITVVIFANTNLKKWIHERDNFKTICKLLIILILMLYLVYSQGRKLSNDEYEHLHKAWMMQEGTIPYFSISFAHMPLLQWISIIFMQVTGESTLIIQTMRLVFYLFSCGSLWLLYLITKELYQSATCGYIAVLLVVSNFVWISESIEVRPDNIMLFFALLSFWFIVQFYRDSMIRYLVLFACFACFSLLGKQNAAVFYFGLGVGFAYDYVFVKRLLKWRDIIFVGIVVIVGFSIDIVREFLILNIKRHMIPHAHKFWPWKFLMSVWGFNAVVFLSFILQIFSGHRLSEKYLSLRAYLTSVSVVSFIFLFLMNRPFAQEMLVMVVFMSILGSGFLHRILQNIDEKLVYVILGIILMPVVIYIPYSTRNNPISNDIEVTASILKISEKDDLVFDCYGQAIFRKHPLDPEFTVYYPEQFERLNELRRAGPEFLIKKGIYYERLPAETLAWFGDNFVSIGENEHIFVRKDVVMNVE